MVVLDFCIILYLWFDNVIWTGLKTRVEFNFIKRIEIGVNLKLYGIITFNINISLGRNC
jgi:hypothetical protein